MATLVDTAETLLSIALLPWYCLFLYYAKTIGCRLNGSFTSIRSWIGEDSKSVTDRRRRAS